MKEIKFKNVKELKKAIDENINVYHHNPMYICYKDDIGQYLITCTSNEYTIGLTWRDGVTLNGNLKEFYGVLDD